MTDREPIAPADSARRPLPRPRVIVPAVDRTLNEFPVSVSCDDGPTMSVTIATRPHSRPSTIGAPAPDPIRAWLARLPADLPAFAPLAIAPLEPGLPAEVHAVAGESGSIRRAGPEAGHAADARHDERPGQPALGAPRLAQR